MNKKLFIGAILSAALALTACSGKSLDSKKEVNSVDCKAPSSGQSSESIKVTGKFGEEHIVKFENPLNAKKTERSQLINGKGKQVTEEASVSIMISVYNAENGKEIAKNQKFDTTLTNVEKGMVEAVSCSNVGSRLATVVDAQKAFGEDGAKTIKAKKDVIIVTDILSKETTCSPKIPKNSLTRAEGKTQNLPEGYPKITLEENGRPNVDVSTIKISDELKISESIVGDGKKVQAGDCVTVHYVGINQKTGKIFDESWARGEANRFLTDKVIPGFTAALVDHKVGSQVVTLIPPSEGYGPEQEGQASTGHIMFVVDILHTTK